jgi:O-antigen/teichoic acid export membrane protein
VTSPPAPQSEAAGEKSRRNWPRRPSLAELWRNPLVRHNLYYLVGIGGSGAGVLIAQSYGAHHLSTANNGASTAVVAVLNLLYTTSYVVAAGTAREVAVAMAEGIPAPAQWRALRRSGYRIGLGLGAAMVPVDVLLAILLHLDDPWILAVTVVAGPLAALGGTQRGYLQGAGDFRRLAINFLCYGLTMVVLAVLLLHLGLGPTAVPIASVMGALGSAVYPLHQRSASSDQRVHPGALIDGTVVAGASTAQIFNNIDVVTARHVLTPDGAGLYSGLSVMGKILFFGTSSLTAVMYPRVAAAPSAAARRHLLLQTFAALATLDLLVVAVYALFSRPLLGLVLGRTYERDSSLLLLFTVGVVGLTVVNLLVYFSMGARTKRFALVPAIGVPALIAWLFSSPPEVTSFVPRIASALLVLAVLEAVMVIPPVLRARERNQLERAD